ncbi:MAG: FAD-dependent oxidoreductase, partial [Desulfobacteraceae bacterium]|nr:FAD-dependent oxidoreductase [Desulfobacteraceae bacterium]
MKNKKQTENKSIVILGAGIAGMAAAQELSRHNLDVHLVEKAGVLGGNAALWACMATDTCQNCGACLVPEMVKDMKKKENVTLHLNQTITKAKQENDTYVLNLGPENEQSLIADKIIVSTGFSPTTPEGLMGEKFEALDQV